MSQPLVLLYEMQEAERLKLKMLCISLHIRTKTVLQEEYRAKLVSLAGLTEKEQTENGTEALGEPMLVMAHFTQKLLDQFLQDFRRKKIAPVSLKAVLTPHNQGWDSYQLFAELQQERAAMEGNTAEKQ